MTKVGTIYIITNLINGKQYVGQTINFKERKRNHLKTKNKKTHLYKAFKLYGLNNFKFEEFISVISNTKNLYSLEMEIIQKLNTYGGNAYNETFGGEGTIGYRPTPNAIKKLKEARVGRKPSLGMIHSEETKALMRKQRQGKNHPLFNKKQKDVSKLKNLMSQKSRKEILCLNTGVIYPSIKSASRDLSIDQAHITGIFSGKYKKAKGYEFIKIT